MAEKVPAVQGSILPDVIDGRHTYAWERVLIYLAQTGGDGDGSIVSKGEVAGALGLSPNTTDYAMTLLRRRGLVSASQRHAPDGGQLANVYRLTQEGVLEAARLMLRALTPRASAAASA